MGLKLFVDDRREFPKGFECVRSFDEAVTFFRLFGDFEFVSLDYNLGDGLSGLDLLRWMKENGKSPAHINIHSDHSEGSRLMRKYAEENFPGAAVTMNAAKS
ncbi:MAG: hypothetical protein IKP47_10285 [Ruminococcus sp.]|nr:hypothetical protein [Ruminococcus sp.]